ncbi:hypothetical protein HC752_21980 [Vibrio sp. S9_S30]|uniref:hypothetical protein n=1 Tax=Vibrio sp. S9_S30 TaxID=2720226 RepID=UPI001680369D|nr:hypothetical protein [Vibrio sp. S9_S30]MBD1559617.1 hypothetical protein [Vibrio sp. S9_S30]
MSNIEKDEAEIIIRHTKNWFMTSQENAPSFATDILAPRLKNIAPSDCAEEYAKWKGSLSRQVNRYLSGEHNFPLQWKHTWLDCLPKRHKESALKEIHAMHGFIDTLPPLEGAKTCNANLEKILNLVSEAVANAKPTHDGIYDENDGQEESNQWIDCLLSVAAACVDESRKVHKGTGAVGTRHNISRFNLDGES